MSDISDDDDDDDNYDYDDDDDEIIEEKSKKNRKISIFTISKSFRSIKSVASKDRSSIIPLNFGDNSKSDVMNVHKYFGVEARAEFFDRYHWISKHRDISEGYSSMISSNFEKRDDIIDYPFAPRRPELFDTSMMDEILQIHRDVHMSDINTDNSSISQFSTDQTIDTEISSNTAFSKLHEVVTTPRTKYLINCTQEGLAPRSALILRKNLDYNLQLQHQGIGDKMGVIFAEALRGLPFVRTINLSDNSLTDISLSKIINSIIELPELTDLDLSRNKVDGEAASSIASYLYNECPIKRLILSDADIDDHECHRFIAALVNNTTLQELDLSRNLIGKSENLNYVQPDTVTGGEAVGVLLSETNCELSSLKLSWNMIRMDGAVALVSSLSTNRFLTHLDISYNALGKEGGEALGKALLTNTSLKYLNIASNGINGTACFAVCVAIEESQSLETFIADENPIGELGASVMMQLPVTSGSRVNVSCDKCNINVRDDSAVIVDLQSPIGDYTLHLDDAFERAVCLKLLRVVAFHETIEFLNCEYEPPPVRGAPVKRKQLHLTTVHFTDTENLSPRQLLVLETLQKLATSCKDHTIAETLFRQYDVDGSNSLDILELQALLQDLGIEHNKETFTQAMDAYDVDGAGTIELEEFLTFLTEQHDDAVAKISDMTEMSIVVSKAHPTVRYIPPTRGIIRFTLVNSFVKKPFAKVLSIFNLEHLLAVCKPNSEYVAKKLMHGIANVQVRKSEAKLLFNIMNADLHDRAKTLSIILPHMADSTETRGLVLTYLSNDDVETLRLKTFLGNSLKPILGMPNGYYSLDLEKNLDRITFSKLLIISIAKKTERISLSEGKGIFGDISQMGDWSCFRNQFIDGERCSINYKHFIPMPRKGKLSFDFYATSRASSLCPSISDQRCVNLLHNFGFVNKVKKHDTIKQLVLLKEENIQSMKGNGEFIPYCNEKRAKAFGICVDKFYDKLPDREKELKRAMKREEKRVDYLSMSLSTPASVVQPNNFIHKTKISIESDSDESTDSEAAAMHDLSNYCDEPSLTLPEEALPTKKETFLRKRETLTAPNFSRRTSNLIKKADAQTKNENVAENQRFPLTIRSDSNFRERSSRIRLSSAERYVLDIGRKFRDINYTTYVPDHVKSSSIVTALENILSRVWIKARQLAVIIENFKVGVCLKTAHFGSYRVELVVSLFSRVVDIYNFDVVLKVLSPYETAAVYCRIGFLSMFNPLKPEGAHWLNLSRHEEREIFKIFAALFTVEGSDTWVEKSLRWEITDDDIPGWSLLPTWMSEEDLPHRGNVFIQFKTTVADVPFRKSLLDMVAIEEVALLSEKDSTHHTVLEGRYNKKYHKDLWDDFLSPATSNSAQIAAGNEPRTIEFNIVKKQAEKKADGVTAKKGVREEDLLGDKGKKGTKGSKKEGNNKDSKPKASKDNKRAITKSKEK